MTRSPARGMTLVELMIGAAIGLFLVAVMGTVYVGSKGTFLAQEMTSRLQENGRFAMDTMGADLRMSGFRGCGAQVAGVAGAAATKAPLQNLLNTPTALLYNFAEPAWGSRYTGAAWSPALAAPVSGFSVKTTGDVLVVRRPSGSGWALTAEMANASGALTVSATANLTQKDLLMVADCGGASFFQATNATPGAVGSIQHLPGVPAVSPGVSSADLGRVYLQDALVWRMQTIVYYLADSVRKPGEVALWSYTEPVYDGGAQQAELVTGVERLGLTFGVDTNGDFAADRFITADAVANWSQVVSTRVELVLVGTGDGGATVAQPYVFGGQTFTPSDRRLRSVVSMAASLRNTVP